MSFRSIPLVVAALLACAGLASADPKADATALNAEGHKLFTAKDYAGAVARFQRAYEIYPSAGLLLNLGTALQQMGHTVEAANIYQRYLDDPGAQEPYATQLRQSLAIADTLAGKLAIGVTGGGGGTEIQLGDGEWSPATHARLVRVAPGTFVVRARLGGRTASSTGRIGAGESRTVELALSAPTPVPAPAQAPVEVEPSPSRELEVDVVAQPRPHRTAAIVAGGAGLVLAVTSVALVLRSSSLYDRASAACSGDPVCTGGDLPRSRSLADDAHTDRVLAVGFGLAGAVALAGGTYLWLHTPHHAVTVSLAPTSGYFGLALDGRF